MPTREVPVQRVSVISSKRFDEVVRELTATIGRPDMKAFRSALPLQRPSPNSEEVGQRGDRIVGADGVCAL